MLLMAKKYFFCKFKKNNKSKRKIIHNPWSMARISFILLKLMPWHNMFICRKFSFWLDSHSIFSTSRKMYNLNCKCYFHCKLWCVKLSLFCSVLYTFLYCLIKFNIQLFNYYCSVLAMFNVLNAKRFICCSPIFINDLCIDWESNFV